MWLAEKAGRKTRQRYLQTPATRFEERSALQSLSKNGKNILANYDHGPPGRWNRAIPVWSAKAFSADPGLSQFSRDVPQSIKREAGIVNS